MIRLTSGSRKRRSALSRALLALWCGAIGVFTDPVDAQPGSSFDHLTTGFRLEGAHRRTGCDSCHSGSIFEGTPTSCVGCHSQSGTVRANAQPSHHITTTEHCEACHRPFTWVPALRVDHLEVFGTCASCHDGLRAGGQPPDHLPTVADCASCHRATAWAPASFDHVGIATGCFQCHDGATATGKPAMHIPATNQCEDCHRVLSFVPVLRVDHMQVLGTCSGCHDGVVATGQHAEHTPTTAECDTCHNTSAWQ